MRLSEIFCLDTRVNFARTVKQYYWGFLKGELNLQQCLREWVEQIKALAFFYGCIIFPKSARRALKVQRSRPLKRKSLLLISYYSPPYKTMYGTQRLEKFIKYLTRGGWDLTLLTTTPPLAQQGREQGPLPSNTQVIRLGSCKARSLRRGIIVPDDFVTWVRPAVEAAKKALETSSASAVYATAPPYSNLIVGAICSKLFDIPLISDFRDPWSKIDIGWIIDHPALRLLNRALEKSILRASDRVIMADEIQYVNDYFVQDNGLNKKVVSIINGYDEEDFFEAFVLPARQSDKFIVSYVGVIYGWEPFECIVRAFRRWHENNSQHLKQVTFEYAGPNGDYFRKADSLPFHWVDHGYVSHSEAIAIRLRSDLQLFAQPVSFKTHVLSGKIYEMIRVGVPILAITHPTGAVANLIEKTGTGFVVSQNDVDGAAKVLRKVYEYWVGGIPAVKPKEDAVRQYSRESLTKRLADVLEDEIKRHA